MNGDIFTYRDGVLPYADRGDERQSANHLQELRVSGQMNPPHCANLVFHNITLVLYLGRYYSLSTKDRVDIIYKYDNNMLKLTKEKL